jgi:hypothetical protein
MCPLSDIVANFWMMVDSIAQRNYTVLYPQYGAGNGGTVSSRRGSVPNCACFPAFRARGSTCSSARPRDVLATLCDVAAGVRRTPRHSKGVFVPHWRRASR